MIDLTELNYSITPTMRKIVFRITYEASHCNNYWDSYQKLCIGGTLLHTTKSTHGIPRWRQYRSVGSIAHILWFCKSLSSFWRQIFLLISSIYGIPSVPFSTLGRLHVGIEKYAPESRFAIIHLLLAAKGNITRMENPRMQCLCYPDSWQYFILTPSHRKSFQPNPNIFACFSVGTRQAG